MIAGSGASSLVSGALSKASAAGLAMISCQLLLASRLAVDGRSTAVWPCCLLQHKTFSMGPIVAEHLIL